MSVFSAWWVSLSLMHQIFYLMAIPATILLVLQTILLLFGVGSGHDADAPHDIGGDSTGDYDADGDFAPEHDMAGDQGAAHEAGLRVLTVRGIVAFLAMAGWVGAASLDMGAHPVAALLLSLAAGVGAMFLVAWLLRASLKLQQSGNLDLANAVGLTGEVYIPIAAGGKGKVTLVVQERFVEMDAICPERALRTGEPVKVTGITESHVLIVAPLYQTTP